MKVSQTTALSLAKKYGIDLDVVPLSQLTNGLNVELEHGSQMGPLTNVTGDDLDKTMKIVLAHLIEDPEYYKHLNRMEHVRSLYWKSHIKPRIFI